MPRAKWKGFLRLSLVACPVALSPATTRTAATPLSPRIRHLKAILD